MAVIKTMRQINAPVERVFAGVSNIENFSQAVPDIVKVEFVSDIKHGKGAKFRETRIMNGREATTELEVTEYQPPERVRFVSDAGGTVWDTVFTTTSKGGGAALAMEMEARPHRFLARLMTPFIMGMVAKAVESDMDAVKSWCENDEGDGV